MTLRLAIAAGGEPSTEMWCWNLGNEGDGLPEPGVPKLVLGTPNGSLFLWLGLCERLDTAASSAEDHILFPGMLPLPLERADSASARIHYVPDEQDGSRLVVDDQEDDG